MKAVKPQEESRSAFLDRPQYSKAHRRYGGCRLDIPVLEIGPGMGVLTQYLVEKPRPVKAVEIDWSRWRIFSENFLTLKG